MSGRYIFHRSSFFHHGFPRALKWRAQPHQYRPKRINTHMDRGLTCRSSADQSQNVFGNGFSDEINRVLREPIFIPLHLLCSDEILPVLITCAQLRPLYGTVCEFGSSIHSSIPLTVESLDGCINNGSYTCNNTILFCPKTLY